MEIKERRAKRSPKYNREFNQIKERWRLFDSV